MRAPERLGPYVYRQSDTCFPLGADSLRLAAFATVRRGDRVCDLGCGAGALLLLLAARESTLELSGVELSPEDGALARQNLAENGLTGTIYTGELGPCAKPCPPGASPWRCPTALLCRGPGEARRDGPHRGGERLDGWCAAAGRLLKNGGRFALVYRPERLAELFAALQAHGMEPKRLQLVQHGPDKPPSVALVEGVRQGRPGLTVLPVHLMNRRN